MCGAAAASSALMLLYATKRTHDAFVPHRRHLCGKSAWPEALFHTRFMLGLAHGDASVCAIQRAAVRQQCLARGRFAAGKFLEGLQCCSMPGVCLTLLCHTEILCVARAPGRRYIGGLRWDKGLKCGADQCNFAGRANHASESVPYRAAMQPACRGTSAFGQSFRSIMFRLCTLLASACISLSKVITSYCSCKFVA